MRSYQKVFIMICLALYLCPKPGHAGDISISSKPKRPTQYDLFTLKIKLPYFPQDTNDPDQLSVEVKIYAPSGKKFAVPAFCLANDKDTGVSVWEARFLPSEAGAYSYYMTVWSKDMQAHTKNFYFRVKGSRKDGFLRRSKNNPYYLVFESGKPFFGIGHNVAWTESSNIRIFDRYFSEMAKNGCNLTRVWICDWSFPLEGTLGKYDTEASLGLDKLFKLAEKRGIYIILCIDTYGNLMQEEGFWNEQKWDTNPYNIKNGGMCASPEDFFFDLKARRFYRNKLRYIVSRWGYSPNIAAFELWNEYNAPAEWVREMADYIKSSDPHGHFITTSHGYPWGEIFDEDNIWALKEIDLITLHLYSDRSIGDILTGSMQLSQGIAGRYDKPFILSEVGIDTSRDDKYYDPEGKGVALHNLLWSSALSKSFGSAMNWWWDSYIRAKRLYYHYRALSRFLKGVNWDSKEVIFPKISPVKKNMPEGEIVFSDIIVKPVDKWGKLYADELVILNNGDVKGGLPTMYLYGNKSREFGKEQIFKVDYPADGEFVIKVGTVSQEGNLVVYLDGEKKIDRKFRVGPGSGEWQRSLYRKDQDVYQCVYNCDVVIDVPRGEHEIRVANTGKDWISLKRIALKNYTSNAYANARCLALGVGDEMLLWVQNKAYNWKNAFNGVEPAVIENAYFDILDVDDGVYAVEWWDTVQGKIVSRDRIQAKNNSIRVSLPLFSNDTACKVKKIWIFLKKS